MLNLILKNEEQKLGMLGSCSFLTSFRYINSSQISEKIDQVLLTAVAVHRTDRSKQVKNFDCNLNFTLEFTAESVNIELTRLDSPKFTI